MAGWVKKIKIGHFGFNLIWAKFWFVVDYKVRHF